MFEEICLVCGKHLQDDGYVLSQAPPPFSLSSHSSLAYCSEDCQSIDTSSPSISSASSVLSSPNLGYAVGGDVPALVPSALGSALQKYQYYNPDHYSVSSSSASSTSWGVLTDEENDDDAGINCEYSFHDSVDSLYEGSSKSANFAYSMRPSALSYTRRPSGTNNRSTVPHLHRRTASGHVHEIPRSAPLQSHLSTDDDGGYSDFGFSSRDESDADVNESVKAASVNSTKSKRSRNRASLPGYFSLLQISSPSEKRSSPKSSSSGNTIARPSPPTPKLPLVGLASGLSQPSVVSIHATPRGRRRATGDIHCDRLSSSESRSPSRPVIADFSPRPLRSRLNSKASIDQTLDWTSVSGHPRGRTAARGNSSPPPKMMLSAIALEDHNRAFAAASKVEAVLGGHRTGRGRPKAEVFEDTDAPGYGNGRSGLMDRGRGVGGLRGTRLL